MRIIILVMILPLQLLTSIPSSAGNSSTDNSFGDQGSSYSSVNMLLGNSLCKSVFQQDVGNALKEFCLEPSKRANELYKAATTKLKSLEKSIDDVLGQLATVKLSTGNATCRTGYERYQADQFCYRLYNNCLTWSEARKVCKQDGGDLISLNHHNFLFFQRLTRSKGDACIGVWVGATDIDKEGKWNWLNGESVGSIFWHPRQPDNSGGKEHCGDLSKPFNYLMNDQTCSSRRDFLCQIA
ncbi:hypothetical protein CHS0354_029575 [Potamilus streckersoni]|uniref:C-type lectin domain-containing protein n=1 Tax=Potamilus streckersoni TaxID=2493646 RepID=A0AAE0SEC8_9BIVA|nr:hypothetical protein CHS0354_029575 [Potamilus streckersoni]